MITEIVSYDGNTFAPDYEIGFTTGSEPRLPPAQARTLERIGAWPVIVALQRRPHRLALLVRIAGSSHDALRSQLFRWFDPEDETPKTLVGQNHAGIQMSVEALCEELRVYGDQQRDTVFVATLAVSGDVRWRAVTETTDSWSITASGQTHTVGNSGEDDAYPTLKVQPTGARTGGYGYKRWIPVRWRVDEAYSGYPMDICNDGFDTQALVGAAKMQADGDDLRVWVDGVEVDRWLDGINTATTKVWVNLDFQAKEEVTLKTAIAGAGAVETIDVNEDVGGFPSADTLVIGSEAFEYTGKNNSLKRFTGVTRAVKGTSMAAHNVSDVVWWVQHDVWIVYGNATAPAPLVGDRYKPAFEVDHSTNVSWVYEIFGNDEGMRTGAWASESVTGVPDFYNGSQGASADPWVEVGMHCDGNGVRGRWRLHNPCGITNVNFTNGERWAALTALFDAFIVSSANGSSWTTEYTIPDPAAEKTWEAWNRNEALAGGSKHVALEVHNGASAGYDCYVEAADATLTLDNTATPTITIGAEQGNYSMACTITNNQTGEAIELAFTMELNEELEVDTDEKTVVYLADGSSQFQALTLVGGARRDWLALEPGNNQLQFDDVGTGNVMIALSWERRGY